MEHGGDSLTDNRLVLVMKYIAIYLLYLYNYTLIGSLSICVYGCPFLLQPTSLNTSEGSIVNFTTIVCSGSVYWVVDDIPYIPDYQSINISVYQTTLANGSIRSDLVITLSPKYNNVGIRATVYTPQLTSSNKVFLKIQGNYIILT